MHVHLRLAALGLFSGIVAQTHFSTTHAQILPPPPIVTPFPPTQSPIPITQPPVPQIPTVPPVQPVYPDRINSVQPNRGQFRVFIDSESSFMLRRVRLIQPDAFLQTVGGRRVIQAGVFTDESKARQQISRFAAQGIPAQLSTKSPSSNASATQSGYYAIVPGSSSEVQEYRERAVRLGVTPAMLQLRDRPRGLHLAVGPFPNRREAEQVVQYLRDRGSLDARLFYDR